MKFRELLLLFMCLVIVSILGGCLSTMPSLSNGMDNSRSVSGATAGSSSTNKNNDLESCEQALGTLALFEDQNLPWWRDYRSRYPNLGTTIPVIRMMVQQSNCFVIVERGRAMQAMQRERQLMASGELRNNSNIGKGQMVAADYTLSPSVEFRKTNIGKAKAVARKFLGKGLPGFGVADVGVNSNEASTTLLLIDNRSGVQVSAAVGSAKNYDFSVFGSGWSRNGFGSVSSFANTDEGKVIMAGFADSYNQMVKALRNYKPQQVRGGLGVGGSLTVAGAAQAKPQMVVERYEKQPQTEIVTVETQRKIKVHHNRNVRINIDDYDEDALQDYYKALKLAVEKLADFSGFTEEQVKMMDQETGGSFFALFWMVGVAGEMETSKIELEDWPLEARQQGWSSLGKKITKYNKLFNKYRSAILKNPAYDQPNKDRLSAVELVTEESLFSEI